MLKFYLKGKVSWLYTESFEKIIGKKITRRGYSRNKQWEENLEKAQVHLYATDLE